MSKTCEYISKDQDPLHSWPLKMCGCATLQGKAYCGEHYYVIYKKGSASVKRAEKDIEKELKELELATLIAEQEEDMEVSDV